MSSDLTATVPAGTAPAVAPCGFHACFWCGVPVTRLRTPVGEMGPVEEALAAALAESTSPGPYIREGVEALVCDSIPELAGQVADAARAAVLREAAEALDAAGWDSAARLLHAKAVQLDIAAKAARDTIGGGRA